MNPEQPSTASKLRRIITNADALTKRTGDILGAAMGDSMRLGDLPYNFKCMEQAWASLYEAMLKCPSMEEAHEAGFTQRHPRPHDLPPEDLERLANAIEAQLAIVQRDVKAMRRELDAKRYGKAQEEYFNLAFSVSGLTDWMSSGWKGAIR